MAKTKKTLDENEIIEYEDVKRMPMAAFLGIGLAFGVALGFSAGNLLFGSFLRGMVICVSVCLIGGFVLGILNKNKRKPE